MNSTVLNEMNYPPEISGTPGITDLQHIHTLPAMPVIAQKMLSLALNTDEGEAQLLTVS